MAVATLFPGSGTRQSHDFTRDFHMPAKKVHFSSLFCDFSLRSPFSLAIVLCGPSFSRKNKG
ncbi:MAG: hypothetical protein DMG35_01680 [Acidobacteria bacterium]|nr:MAG: hypothetical protein DMG35_01680 [Acidobacteriota bacterium]